MFISLYKSSHDNFRVNYLTIHSRSIIITKSQEMTSQIPVHKGRLPKKPHSLVQQLQIHSNQGLYTNPEDHQKLLCICYKYPPDGALVSKVTFYRYHDEVTAASKHIGWSFNTLADFLQVEQNDKCW